MEKINLLAKFFAEMSLSNDKEVNNLYEIWSKRYNETKTSTSFTEATIKANELVLRRVMEP